MRWLELSVGRLIRADQDGFRRRRFVSECRVWSFGVVVSPPPLDQDPTFPQCSKGLGVENLVAELTVEAFIVAVFPRALWCDV